MKYTWQVLEVPVLMLISLAIQALLAFLAPLRKSSANGFLMLVLWLLYLSADSVALIVIGLISRSHLRDGDPRADILAFWAPFLLLHLGGPDTITALALEDNELWHRHALQLATQTAITLYVFSLSIGPGSHNRLQLPMVLMFIDGFIKYVERTCALYFASMEGIRASLGEESIPFNRCIDEYYNAEISNIPSEIEVLYGFSAKEDNVDGHDGGDYDGLYDSNNSSIEDVEEIINLAYRFYENFKGILADDVLSLKDDHMLVDVLFLKQHVRTGISIILTELNLIYDLLHTKVFLVYEKRGILRLACFLSVITASLLFLFSTRNNKYNPIDAGVTFALLGGAIVLDITAFVRFIRSDWFIIMVNKLTAANDLSKFSRSVLCKLCNWSIWSRDHNANKRWCQSISSYNLLNCSYKQQKAYKYIDFIKIKRIKDLLIEWLYVKRNPIKHSYLKYIFTDLQRKAKLVSGDKDGIEEVCGARGSLVLEDDYFLISRYLRPWTMDVDYSQSLLTWHIATDICYWIESDKYEPRCGLSKQLSDYMVYLLLRRQELLPQLVGKSDVHFKRTINDILDALQKAKSPNTEVTDEFCKYVVFKKIDDRLAAKISKLYDSQSVFDEACCLAKQLMMFGDKKWDIISKVWIEMLCYAAVRSSPRHNFANLSKGGELITLVWLYMSHLGFRLPVPEIRRVKLTIDK